jgi:DnaA family protein
MMSQQSVIQQLPLLLNWHDHATFDNFYVGENPQIVALLKNLVAGRGERCIYIYGANGSGLSHLLQASCQAATKLGKTAAYLPLKHAALAPEILEGLEMLDVICIDDIHLVAGQRNWEEHIFHLYNRLLLKPTGCLAITSQFPIKQLHWQLPDLSSRLSANVVLQMKPLADEEKVLALQVRAKLRGLQLSPEVAQYLLHRFPRDMPALFNTLEKLDYASLAAQKKLTVPFVKGVLG